MGPNMTPVGILDRFDGEFAAAGVLGHWVTPDEVGEMPNFKGAYRRIHHFRAGVVFADPMVYKMLTTSLLYQL